MSWAPASRAATGYASPSRGARETSLWRIEIEAGSESPVHSLEREEVFLALSGAAEARLDGVTYEVTAGDCLMVAPGQDFAIAARGEEPFEAVVCMPAGGRARLPDGQTLVPPWAE